MLAGAFPLALKALDRVLFSSDSNSLAGGNLVLLASEALDTELFAADFELMVLAGGNRSFLGAFDMRLFRSELEPTSLADAPTSSPAVTGSI